MSDSEDDYMSDKFLNQCSSIAQSDKDIRPGLLFNPQQKRQHELYKQKQEQLRKKPKTAHEREKESREIGLNTAISSDNKGFKLLEKMGFKPGEALGKSQAGLKEPIKVEVRHGKSGIGLESRIKEKITKKLEQKTQNFNQTMRQFKDAIWEKNAKKFLCKDMHAAQKACEEMDCRQEIEPKEDFFWTELTIQQRQKIDPDDPEELEEFHDLFESYTSLENLNTIIDYLRDEYLYCMYCGFVASDKEDLESNCPGPYRNDHDDG